MEKTASPLVTARFLGKTAAYSALAAGIFIASHAQAQLLNNVTIGNPKALGMANAVTADPPGVDSIHFNPAGLSKIQGRQRQVKVLVAHMVLESEFGEPTLPDAETKDAFLAFNQECQDEGWTADVCWGDDPVANTSVKSGDPLLMLPFAGMVDLPILAVPTGGIAFEDAANGWVFGTAVYSPEGVGYSRDEDEGGAYQGIRVGVTRLTYFSPTVAIQVSDELSLGAGVTFSYQGLGIETKFRAPLITTQFLANLNSVLPPDAELHIIGSYDTVGLLEMEMDDYLSVGFNFGILWEPKEWLAFGFSYRSESTSDLSGDFKMTNTDDFLATSGGLKDTLGLPLDVILGLVADGAPFNVQKVESGTVELEYITPQTINFGTSIKVLPNLKVNLDARWIEYSVWDTLDFKFDRNVDFLTLASVVNRISGVGDYADPDEMRIRREYEDSWSLALGVEYTLNDNFVLRFGYEPRTSSIPDDATDLLFPITEADLYTTGFGWQFNKTTRIEGAFGYLYSNSKTPSGGSTNANSEIEGDVVYNPYFATDFENTTTAYLFALSIDQKF
ncbi:MAG: outer membrane protein transport protein [Gammaproteobacteria bacterium]